MAPQSIFSLRLTGVVFAGVLALQAVWLIAAELSRPGLSYFPVKETDVEDVAAHQSAAALAAHIGWPRGDLSVDHAISASSSLLETFIARRNTEPAAGGAYKAAETAAALAPADARAWLLLAMLNTGSSNESAALAQLRMSYYTSPFNDDLFPARMQIVARLNEINDDELRSFAEYEIGFAAQHKPELKSFIVSAFRNASPAGRQLLEAAIGNKDAQLLAELRSLPVP